MNVFILVAYIFLFCIYCFLCVLVAFVGNHLYGLFPEYGVSTLIFSFSDLFLGLAYVTLLLVDTF